MGDISEMGRKGIAILGSTGSVGVNTLGILKRYSDRFEVVGLTAWGNSSVLKEQIVKHRPKLACVSDEEKALNLKDDPAEQNDLAQTKPKKAAKLLKMLQAWRKEVSAQMMPKK